ncbi:olfactory receptor class A-like protein 1 [Bombina bombina]|uniref:olfactory receptor class A-like protein 1 n=1 Tax=Bombina bombina TaxID=8345 RepID=UPI00235A5F13|nr:olfactory receptor class A-like protein 1 [Bombina bombina]
MAHLSRVKPHRQREKKLQIGVMDLYKLVKVATYSGITVVGVAGNSMILVVFAIITYQEHKLVGSELILSHLSLANLLGYLTRIFPTILFEMGVKGYINDAGCKLTSAIFRVFRGMAISLTCLLSCFQGVILSSSGTSSSMKTRIQEGMSAAIGFLYVMNITVNTPFALYATPIFNTTGIKYVYGPGYCIVVYPDKVSFEASGFVSFALDLVLVVLMVLASSYILWILHRHSKQVKGLRSSSSNKRGPSAETQAARAVVTLVTFYVTLYGIDNTIWLYQTVSTHLLALVTDIRVKRKVNESQRQDELTSQIIILPLPLSSMRVDNDLLSLYFSEHKLKI